MDKSTDLVVVGGGVIGLTIAWQLARAGATVTVLERGRCGDQASNAAAGMLAPLAEAHEPGAFCELGLESLRSYPDFLAQIHADSGITVEIHGPGMLRVITSQSGKESAREQFDWQSTLGLNLQWLDHDELHALEPMLPANACAALLSPRERHVDPRQLIAGLRAACLRREVRIVEDANASGFDLKSSRVEAVHTSSCNLACAGVILAGGAWSEEIGRQLNVRLPVIPVRGQMLALRSDPLPIRHIIYDRHHYAIPRDGRILLGATMEEVGFDTRTTAGGLAQLLCAGCSLVPSLTSATFESAWAGLRPATPDDLPLLGRMPGYDNAYVATGHFRNGILLAPITGQLMTRLILQNELEPRLAPFEAGRFPS